MGWLDQAKEYQAAGFTDSEIAAQGDKLRGEMSGSGFGQNEIDDYFGVKNPDMTPVKKIIEENLKTAASDPAAQKPEEADSFLKAIEAGFKFSSSYMATQALRGKSVTPDMVLPEHAPMAYRIASQAATLAGDLPEMVAGAMFGAPAGAAGGSAVPVVGTTVGAAVGAGAGGAALPAAIRQTLMQYYEKGDIHDFSDFWERSSAVFLDTLKAGVVGGATMGVGSGAAGLGASRLAQLGAEVATMTTLGKGLEGQVPTAQDFVDGAVLVAGLHVATGAPAKLREIYAKTGVRPEEVAKEAQENPVLKQELLAEGDKLPLTYEKMATEAAAKEGPAKVAEIPPVEAKPAPEETIVLKTPEQTILDRIGEKGNKPKASYTKDDFYKDYVDRLDPIQLAVKELGKKPEELMADKNPYILARMASDSKAKVQHFFEKGVLDFKTLETTGKPFNEIIDPVKSDLGGLKAYMVSKRALELEGRGINSGFDVEAAKDVVARGKKTFETPAKELVDFQNGAVKYLKDSGILSDESFRAITEANKSYVSFKRISEDGETVSGGTKKNPIKKIKGSDLKIQDPFLSMIENTDLYLRLAEKNRAVSSLVDLAEKTPNQNVIEKIPGKSKPVSISTQEVAKFFEKLGIEDADPEAFSVFRGQDKQLGPNEFEVFREGKREIYKTNPVLAEAIKILDGNAPAQNLVFKLARGITAVKRVGITLTPDFIIKNWFRDQLTASTFSKTGAAPFWEVFSAMGDLIKKNDNYYNWLKAGGANGAFLKLGDKYLNENIYKLDEQTKFIDKTWNLVQKPVHYLEAAGQLAEQATRLAAAKRVMGEATSGPKVFEAGYASRESTVDFQRVGAKISALNAITAFQNASIQGIDRTFRAIKEDPSGVAIKAATWITAPSVLLWWANKDDERVKDLPAWQRDTAWIIATDKWEKESLPGEAASLPSYLVRDGKNGKEINKGTLYRFPKPQELGILFGSVPERLLDKFFTDNPDALKDFGTTIQNMLTPSLIPDIAAPVAEQYFNKSLFTNSKLVPGHLEGLLPQYQYTNYTSDTAKALSKLITPVPFIGNAGPQNAPLSSPMVIENYVRSWSGTLGMYALQLADKGLQSAGVTPDPIKPASSLSDIPFVKAFVVRYPSASTNSIQKFYEAFEENKQALDTVKALGKQGNVSEAEKLMNDPSVVQHLQDLSGVQEALKNQGHFIQMIYKNPEMNPDEKRQLIDGAYYGMIETAKSGVKLAREWKKNLEEQKKVLGK